MVWNKYLLPLGMVFFLSFAQAFIVLASLAAETANLNLQIKNAPAGAVLKISAGIYLTNLTINKPLTLEGALEGAKGGEEKNTIIDGQGNGNVITINAPNVTIRNITIRNSGDDLDTENSGIFLTKKADNALIENNLIQENLIGVNLKGPTGAIIRGNKIIGRSDLRVNERGNNIHLWNTPESQIIGNVIRFGRDGIFTTTSHHNLFQDNDIQQTRFAFHYMYTNDSVLRNNVSKNNYLGFAIMYSDRLTVENNSSLQDEEHGFLFNYANHVNATGNQVHQGGKKCLFIYNAHYNHFRDNVFSDCRIGLHFTAGSEQNQFSGNGFINNVHQVKYVGTRHLEWSENQQGNYWSDYSGFDFNDDGVGDLAYQPNDVTDRIIWRVPQSKILLTSPALQFIRHLQSSFPSLFPGGVKDSFPLMNPPASDNPIADFEDS